MKFEILLTQFEKLDELVYNSMPEPHLDEEMREALDDFEKELNYAMNNASKLNYSPRQKEELKKMDKFIQKTHSKIQSAVEDFKRGIYDDMYPNGGDEPMDPFDY
jgi:hypothetical protein